MRAPRFLLACAWLSAGCTAVESGAARFDPDAIARMFESPILAELDAEPAYPAAYLEQPVDHTVELLPPPRIAGDDQLALNLRGMPLAEAIHLIAAEAGVNVYLDAGLDEPVDASFPAVTLDGALQALLARNGLALVEEPAGIFWVRRADGSQAGRAHFQLRSVAAADVSEELTTLVGTTSTIVIDDVQNVVMVSGSQQDVEIVAEYLAAVDRLKPQVLLEVRLLEARLDERFELGFEHGFSGDAIAGNPYTILQSLAASSNSFSATLSDEDGDLESTLTALSRYVGLELVTAPRVLTVTNTEATIEVVEEVPYIDVTATSQTGGDLESSVVEEVAFKEVGIKLVVTPTVQDAGVLQVRIDQELSEVVDFFNNIPVVDSRHLATTFLVADRQTVVLGGLMQDRRLDRDEGVPGLMHVPFIGPLFRREDDTTEKRELLVFVTPRIVDPDQAARLARKYGQAYREERSGMAARVDQSLEAEVEDE